MDRTHMKKTSPQLLRFRKKIAHLVGRDHGHGGVAREGAALSSRVAGLKKTRSSSGTTDGSISCISLFFLSWFSSNPTTLTYQMDSFGLTWFGRVWPNSDGVSHACDIIYKTPIPIHFAASKAAFPCIPNIPQWFRRLREILGSFLGSAIW